MFFIHDSRETKVCNEEIGVIFGRSEEEVLGLEISMYYTVIVEVGDCGESRTDEVGGIRFVVGAFSAYAVEQLTTECKISYQIH